MLDVIQGSSSSGAAEPSSSDSSLVVSAVPSTEDTTATTVAVTIPAVVAAPVPSTTAAPVAKVAPRAVAPTTTAPRPATTVAPVVQSEAAFLACVRQRESRGNYSASDPSGTFLGAYQIYQGGWDSMASRIGRHDLVGVPPNQASPADQDTIAAALYRVSGSAPWGGICG
ncbi:MAG: transglycosylase family protein [Acidimicrobiia bacterium]|nr:transglycosylase family protein [Acidimicrobiia bacterium]